MAAVIEAGSTNMGVDNAFVRAGVLPRAWGGRGSLVPKIGLGINLNNAAAVIKTTNRMSTKRFLNFAFAHFCRRGCRLDAGYVLE